MAYGFDNTFFFAFCLTLVSVLHSLTLHTIKKMLAVVRAGK
ncbi:MAG: hypothetical protein ACE3JK_16650 [Sporolactobacillus sp.]